MPMTSAIKNSPATITSIANKDELAALITSWKKDGHRIGFVPTMGALHDGHLSLVEMAKKHADKIIVSIFVNPTQFAPHEDLDTYPRTINDDLEKLEAIGTDAAYLPRVEDLYPEGPKAHMKAGSAAQGLESDFRPHFFDGVVSVVHRLFEQVKPDMAIFGEKDFQQLMVIKEMVDEHHMPVTIIPGAIIREPSGLAMSSRNAYLSEEEQTIAAMLYRCLVECAANIGNDPQNAKNHIKSIKEKLLNAGFNKIDYLEKRWNRLLIAAYLGKTRLIDNIEI